MARRKVRVRVRVRAGVRVRLKCGGPGRTLIAVGSSEKREASTPTTAMCSMHGRVFAPSAAWMHSMSLGSVCGIMTTSPSASVDFQQVGATHAAAVVGAGAVSET